MALKKPKCVGKKLKNIVPNTKMMAIALSPHKQGKQYLQIAN
jgi:hypothetical protein